MSGGGIGAADYPQALRLLDTRFAIFQLPPDEQPSYLAGLRGELVMVTRTADEVTVICPEPELQPQVQAEHDWRALKVEAPLELASAVGVLTALTGPIAAAGIAIFAVSTWANDYISSVTTGSAKPSRRFARPATPSTPAISAHQTAADGPANSAVGVAPPSQSAKPPRRS